VVFALTVGVVGWTAWPTLRPVRKVHVTQAVFDRAVAEPTVEADRRASAAAGGRTVQAAGWLEAEPYVVACAALADGVIETIEALEGDPVQRGEVVARLVSEDSELRLARAEAALAGARGELALAQAELHAAQTDWDEPVERERAVEAGRAALAEGEAEVAQLPSLIAAERATLVRLQEELSRAEESAARGAATDIEVIIARQRVEALRATVESLEARRPMLEARADRLRAELRAAERNLTLRVAERRRLDAATAGLAMAQAAVDRAAVARDEAALELERMTIRAPIDGYVQRRLKAPGDKVVRNMDDPHSAHVMLLYDPAQVQARVDVPLADASQVVVGQRCEVVVEVLPDQKFEGETLRVTHEADLQKNTLQVKVRVLDPSPLLRPEMLTRVKFLPPGAAPGSGAQHGEGGPLSPMLVPPGALTETGGATRVWAVRDRRGDVGVVRPVPVRVLGDADGWVSVSGTINPGELLVLDAGGLAAGDRVRITRGAEGGGS